MKRQLEMAVGVVCSLLQHLGLPAPFAFSLACMVGFCTARSQHQQRQLGTILNLDPAMVDPCRTLQEHQNFRELNQKPNQCLYPSCQITGN